MAKTSLILIITFFLAQTLNSTEIYGVPKIIDGDTVHINNKKIRLEGIDAPEINQQCKKPFLKISAIIGFKFNKDYSCGVSPWRYSDPLVQPDLEYIMSLCDQHKIKIGITTNGVSFTKKQCDILLSLIHI